MTPTVPPIGFLLALAAPPDQAVSPLIQLIPFALVLAIFYFVIFLPMKRRQKKVAEFLDALKVGDKVVTSGGLYASIAKLGDQSVQLQIAPNVRVDVSRAAIVATRARPPWSKPPPHKHMAKNLRWKTVFILAVVALSIWSFYPPDQKVRLIRRK